MTWDGGDESRVSALMAEVEQVRLEAAQWHGSFTGLAAREQELMAENSALRIDNENMYYAMGEVERLRTALTRIARYHDDHPIDAYPEQMGLIEIAREALSS